MAVDPVPYVVHGAKHSADVFRQAFHDLSAGAEGVSLPQSLHVKQTGTPSGQVQVMPGGVILPNTYSGGGGQSYTGRVASSTLVDVPASDSTGAKSYYIIFRVSDPQFGGQAPADPLVGPYAFLECVPASGAVQHPHYRLARVDVPKNTGTITNAMITDLREVAMPRRWDEWRPRALVAADTETLTASGEVGEYFPNAGGPQTLHVPAWATRAQIRCEWLAVRYGAGNAYGQMWVEYGPYGGPSLRERSTQKYQFDTPAASNVSRANWVVVDDVPIPASYRGTDQLFVPKARRLGGVTNSVQMDSLTGMSLEVRFLQVAEPSTT